VGLFKILKNEDDGLESLGEPVTAINILYNDSIVSFKKHGDIDYFLENNTVNKISELYHYLTIYHIYIRFFVY
jgi:hypothetical protein